MFDKEFNETVMGLLMAFLGYEWKVKFLVLFLQYYVEKYPDIDFEESPYSTDPTFKAAVEKLNNA